MWRSGWRVGLGIILAKRERVLDGVIGMWGVGNMGVDFVYMIPFFLQECYLLRSSFEASLVWS